MITILNGVLITIITVFAGIFYFILSKDYDHLTKLPDQVSIISIVIIIIGLLYIILVIRLRSANKEKILSDNNRYEKFRRESLLERDFLGLTDYFKNINPNVDIYWVNNTDPLENPAADRKGSGDKVTFKIINIYSESIIFIVSCLTITSLALLFNK
ncbi:MAG: hypothetical protein ABJA71_09810 [Ginsengibacter sp.]